MARRKNRKHGPRGSMTEEEIELVVRAYMEYNSPEHKPGRRVKAMHAMAFGRSEDFMRKLEICLRTGKGCNGASYKRAAEMLSELDDGGRIATTPNSNFEPAHGNDSLPGPDFIEEEADHDGCEIEVRFDGHIFTMESSLTPHDIINRLGIKRFVCELGQ